MSDKKDVYITFEEEMFKHLLSRKEVIITHEDGSAWHFKLSNDINWPRLTHSLSKSINTSVTESMTDAMLKSKDATKKD